MSIYDYTFMFNVTSNMNFNKKKPPIYILVEHQSLFLCLKSCNSWYCCCCLSIISIVIWSFGRVEGGRGGVGRVGGRR